MSVTVYGVVLILISAANLFALLFLLRYLHLAKNKMERTISEFISAPDEATPSPFAKLTEQIGLVLSTQIGTTVMAAIRGALGGVAKGVNAEVTKEAIASSPALSLVNTLVPSLGKKLGRNPAALMGLQGLLGNIIGGNQGNGGEAVKSNKKHRGFEW